MISLKVDTLRALSQCFGVKRSSGAKEAVLIGRLLSYCELGILKDVTEEGERAGGEDDGNAYGNTRHATAEEKTVLKTLPDFKTVTTGWTKDLTALQKLWIFSHFVDIFKYLVESRESTFDKEKMEAYKSLKGVKYMEDGLVRNVWSKSFEPGDQVSFFKTHIYASWTVTTSYSTFVAILSRGLVCHATCSCPAGLGGTCSHVAGLLFYIVKLKAGNIDSIPEDTTCTGKPCEWNKPPRRDVQPQHLTDIKFRKLEFGKDTSGPLPSSAVMAFDPRNGSTEERRVDARAKLLNQLEEAGPDGAPASGVLYFWDRAPLLTREKEEKSFEMKLGESFIVYDGVSPLSDEIDDEELIEQQMIAILDPSCTMSDICTLINAGTVEQASSSLWLALHNGRITSSKAGQVFHRRPTISPDKLVASLMGYDQKEIVTAAVSWGKRNETIAQKAYIEHMQNHGHPGLKVLPAGFTMYSSATYIGASSDGVVIDPCVSNSRGCLQIKFPFSVDGYQITDFMPQEIPLIAGSKFFMEKIQNNSSISLQLRRSSKHYCQVMCEMAVLEVLWCDFVVWTPAGVYVQRIDFDEDLWSRELFPKLQDFFTKYLLREIVTHRVQRGQPVLPTMQSE